MTDKRELNRLLDAFFVEGTNELPDRVIDAALDQIDDTQQRRAVRVPRRFTTMNMSTRLATAAVIGVLAVGGTIYLLGNRQADVGPSPAASTAATAVQTAPPSVPPSGPPSVRAPRWAPIAEMLFPHGGHAATLLPDGRVLVAGGSVPFLAEFADTAELYDAATGIWAETGRMGRSRSDAAIVLSNGKVLVVGWDGGDVPRGTELYDPATGTWSAGAPMIEARTDFTTTLLADGRVLVAGGNTPGAAARGSAELYDPSTGTWRTTGDMTEVRSNHTATLLPDGRVLVAGGGNDDSSVASAELYDPARGTWTATADMHQDRGDHGATLLANGRVLVVGGGATSTGAALSSAELYDPATGTWSVTGDMTEARTGVDATRLPGGKVLVAGGHGLDGVLSSAELYNPATGTWAVTANMVQPRFGSPFVLLPSGSVLVSGGLDRAISQTAELYDPGGE